MSLIRINYIVLFLIRHILEIKAFLKLRSFHFQIVNTSSNYNPILVPKLITLHFHINYTVLVLLNTNSGNFIE